MGSRLDPTDETAQAMPMHVAVALMKGVGEGAADMYYGNNVSMVAGHRYLVVVALGNQRVAFTVTAPKTEGMH